MKKSDNFNAAKWLVENKITTQSRLNEKIMEILNENPPSEIKLIKKGTKFKNNFNGKILTVAKDFEVTLPIDKKSGRKFVMMYSPEYKSGYNPSGIERFQMRDLFNGGFTQID
jgi:lipopolysaccharide biosynthesis glycosyltransferase